MNAGVPQILSEEDLAYFRALAEASLPSTVTVRRKGQLVEGPDGLKHPSWDTVLTGVPFKLGRNAGPGLSRTVTIGNTEVQVAVRTGKFPAGTQGIRDGDVVEITSGENAGVFVSIVDSLGNDQQVALRLPVVQIQRPDGWPT